MSKHSSAENSKRIQDAMEEVSIEKKLPKKMLRVLLNTHTLTEIRNGKWEYGAFVPQEMFIDNLG